MKKAPKRPKFDLEVVIIGAEVKPEAQKLAGNRKKGCKGGRKVFRRQDALKKA